MAGSATSAQSCLPTRPENLASVSPCVRDADARRGVRRLDGGSTAPLCPVVPRVRHGRRLTERRSVASVRARLISRSCCWAATRLPLSWRSVTSGSCRPLARDQVEVVPPDRTRQPNEAKLADPPIPTDTPARPVMTPTPLTQRELATLLLHICTTG